MTPHEQRAWARLTADMAGGMHQYDYWQDVPDDLRRRYLHLIGKEDGQLTELAARAAGIDLMPDGDGVDGSRWVAQHVRLPDGQCVWHPLQNDAHAFRLATKLHIDLHFDDRPGFVTALATHPKTLVVCGAQEPVGSDENAATRRAIVRVAAALAAQQ